MEVISTRRYEARPPPSTHSEVLINPENSVALVKEEEWETRKKKEITTTRQIETRVKRQVVLEDGEVVVDSGPLVTTNTTEDVEQQEHTTQERRTTGDQPQEVEWPAGGKGAEAVVQKELNETVVRSREEIEERLETEDRQQLGDISDEAYQKAVRSNRGDLRAALAESTKQLAPQTGPRVIQHTTRSNKVVDTEKTLEKKELKADGLIVTERKRTVEHEEIKDDEVPDDGGTDDEPTETRKESSQRFAKKRDEDVVDYVSGGERVAREMRYVAETTEGERIGDWSPSPPTMRTTRLHKYSGFPAETPAARKDALTRKPLDLEEEDEARKFETSKWLESHFGSESRSSHGSMDADDSPIPVGTNTSYINVTMKSRPSKERREYQEANSSRHRTTTRDATPPSGYFHGISEWSERYQGRGEGKERHNSSGSHTRTASPPYYVESPRTTNGHAHEHNRNQVESTYSRTYESIRRRERQESVHERQRTPSPPVRRKSKDQWPSRPTTERTGVNEPSSIARTSSPVHVVQRTWESRGRDRQGQNGVRDSHKKSPPRSRSVSPKPAVAREEKKSNEAPRAKSSSHSKYKIGESFRKLVGKLRSASTERRNKRTGYSSTSQLTQTDDNGPTYLQYNVIDKNIPLVSEKDLEERPPARPPRNSTSVKPAKPPRTEHEQTTLQECHWQRSESTPPLQRYYLGEDPFGGSIYGREKGYRDSDRTQRRRRNRNTEATEYSSLGRFSKSTGRLAAEYERDEQFRAAQTLPRNLRSTGQSRMHRQCQQVHSGATRQGTSHVTIGPPACQPRQYGSMINISIKNAVKTPTHTLPAPAKPERTYKSVLSRSKSFNVEADRNGDVPPKVSYTSNLQLNRLNETPPLKSPGILASISRSNRDLIKDNRNEY